MTGKIHYQIIHIKFKNGVMLNFTDYPDLCNLATWSSESGRTWKCKSLTLQLETFKKQFYAITQTTEQDVAILDSGTEEVTCTWL